MTATVKNTGTGTAYRVLPRLQADDTVFEDVELPIGKVAPGETKTFTAKVKVPTDALDRVDRLGVEVREARNAPTHVAPAELKVEAAAHARCSRTRGSSSTTATATASSSAARSTSSRSR